MDYFFYQEGVFSRLTDATLSLPSSSRCQNGAYCSNRRFQMRQHAEFDVILTEDKGWGLRAAKDLPSYVF